MYCANDVNAFGMAMLCQLPLSSIEHATKRREYHGIPGRMLPLFWDPLINCMRDIAAGDWPVHGVHAT